MRKELDDINEANALEMAMAKSVNLVDLFRGNQRVLSTDSYLTVASNTPLYSLWSFPDSNRVDLPCQLRFRIVLI